MEKMQRVSLVFFMSSVLFACGGGGTAREALGPTSVPSVSPPAATPVARPVSAWAVGRIDEDGAVLRSDDTGLTWSVAHLLRGLPEGVRGVSFPDANLGWVVGHDEILRTEDGGMSWSSQRGSVIGLERTPLLEAVAFAGGDAGIAVGSVRGEPDPTSAYPLVLVTSDGGRTWTRAALPVAEGRSFAMQHVCLRSDGVALAAGLGFSGEIGLVSRDAGRSWRSIPQIGTTHSAGAVACPDGGSLWLGSFGPEPSVALLVSDDGGESFSDGTSRVAASPFAWSIWGDPLAGSGGVLTGVSFGPSFGVAVGVNESNIRDAFGVAGRSVDGGRTWVRGSLPEGTGALRDVTVTPNS